MKLLIKQARVVDPHSPFNDQITDIYIENGTIAAFGDKKLFEPDQEIRLPNLHVSPGWVDSFADFSDPGYEFRETLESGAAAAVAGGYTHVFVIPNTKPPIHNKAAVEYIMQKSRSLPIDVHPIGAVTTNLEGKELAEMYDMHASGAIAFGDGTRCIQSTGLLVKALQYVKAFNGIIIQLPDDKSLQAHGLMNEGIISTQLGLPGKPAVAEELIVARDIKLARYADSRLHFTGLSTQKSLEYVQRGKDSGTGISCAVTPYHLYFCDEDLQSYDTNLKVNPPLRTRQEREALKEAVQKGWVDCIASHHQPYEFDSKVLEFEYAKSGMIGLETAFAVLQTAVPGIPVQKAVELLAINPRKLFGLEPATLKEGNKASITLFDPSKKWVVQPENILSRSKNSPFMNKELTGKSLGIIHKGAVILN